METFGRDIQLSVNGKLFEYIIEHCAEAVVAIDGAQKIILFNEAAETLFGYPRDAVVGADVGLLLPQELRKRHTGLIDAFAKDGESPARYMGERDRQIQGLRRDGTTFPAEISIMRSGAADSPVMVAIVRDMSDQRHLEQALHNLASTDSLTGVLNRRAFTERVEPLLAAAHDLGRPVSVLLMDLDNFKRLNDTYGHTVGDLAITQASNSFADCLRKSDLLCRWGGEEFVALLPHADARAAYAIAERVRGRIEEDRLYAADVREAVRFTASIGIAVRTQKAETFDSILNRADTALYQAKQEGRNRVIVADENPAQTEHG